MPDDGPKLEKLRQARMRTINGDRTYRVGWKKLNGDWAYVDNEAKVIWFDPRYPSRLALSGYIAHEAGHVAWGLTEEHSLIDMVEHNVAAISAALGICLEEDD